MVKKKTEVEKEEKIVENPVKNKMSDKTRYLIIGITTSLLLILIIVLVVVGDKPSTSSNYYNDNSNSSNSTSNSTSTSTSNANRKRNTSTDALKSFYEAFDSKELKVIFFARTSCGYCSLQKPILKQIAEDYDIDYYAIDTDKLESVEVEEIMYALDLEGSTPTTVVVKEGKIIGTNVGYLDGKPYVDFFVKYGILKEGSTYKPEDKLVSIDYSEFKNISKKDKTSLVLIDSKACSSCISVRSTLNKLAKENGFKINYLSERVLTSSDINSLVDTDLKEMEFDEKTYKEEGSVSVPLLLVVKDNKIIDYVVDSTEESDFTKVLKKHNFIK